MDFRKDTAEHRSAFLLLIQENTGSNLGLKKVI
jgi:hypothetical protein